MRLIILLLTAFCATLAAQTSERFPGFRVYQGDMLLGPESAVTNIPARLWTNNTVPYVIDPDIPNPDRIMGAIAWYNANTPVTYQARGSQANFVHYVRSTVGNGVCHSSVGMLGGEQFIRVEDTCTQGTLIHEMTHTTGFYHEQDRQDRNQNATVLYENIDKSQFGEFGDPGSAGEQDMGGYDYASHMHYGAFSFSRDGSVTIESVPAGIPFDSYTVLSPGDLDTLFRMYGKPPTQTTVTTNPPGLQMVIDGATVTAPQVYNWAPGSTHTLAVAAQTLAGTREVFAKWSDGGAASHTITASAATTIYSANFYQQVPVTTSGSPATGGTVSVDASSADGYFTARTTLVLTAKPNAGYKFLDWQANTGCPFRNSQNPQTVNVGAIAINCVAVFTQAPMTTITTDPPGIAITVDGSNYTHAPVNFAWAANSTHNISTATPPSNAVSPTRYIFQGWSDGKAAAHSVTAGTSATTITATFKTQYILVLPSTAPANGTVTVTPPSTDNFYEAGTVLTISAVPMPGRTVTPWTGDLFGQPNPATLTMTSQMTFGVTFPASVPALSVVNGANFSTNTMSPGELVTIFGAGIGPAAFSGAVLDATGKFPTSLSGTTVRFGNTAAPLVYTSANQVAALVPYALANNTTGTTAVSVVYNGKTINGPTLSVAKSAPGIFTVQSSGIGTAVIQNADGTINSADHPAPKGSVIVLYATGEGQIAPGGVDGAITGTPLPVLTQPAGLRIGGKPAVLQYAGEAPGEVSGVMQVNAVVPPDAPSGMVSVYLAVGNQISPVGVWMYVE
jgi:uncharacterized protein (TIGR03437 family)